jgi:hypothetical protein
MRLILACLVCLPASGLAAETLAGCAAKRIEIARQAEAFHGDPQSGALIQADLKRAGEEIAEHDARECSEALDHAARLLAGKY